MLGWNISVFRQIDGGSLPATADVTRGSRVAAWQARLDGLKWLNALVEAGHGIDLGGDGYPNYYTVQSAHLLPTIIDGPPEVNRIWWCGPEDTVTSGWAGKTVIDHALVEECRPDEWLLVVAWDES